MNGLLPIVMEKDEDGVFVVECPALPGCYSQGKTLDEAMKNIREVLEMIKDEDEVKRILSDYGPREFSFHTISF